jgi:type I restriction enzyme, R subunit
MDVVRGMFSSTGGFDYSAYKTEPLQVLIPAANHILGLDDGKKRYADSMASVTKSYSLCSTLDEAAALREEIAFFSAVRAVIIKMRWRFTTHCQRNPKFSRHWAAKP